MTKRWFVKIPTYMGMWEEVRLWEIEEVEVGTDREQMLMTGRTINSAGEWVESSFICFPFDTYEDAHSFIEWHWEREQ